MKCDKCPKCGSVLVKVVLTRIDSNGFKTGYFYWNLTSEDGVAVATGVYVWQIVIRFDNGGGERFIVKTGVIR